MIDMHTYILPGLDGAVTDMEESLAIAEAAVENGIDTIIAIPRYIDGEVNNTKMKINQQVNLLNDRLQTWNLPLTILPGQQAILHDRILDSTSAEALMPIAGNSQYLMIELPPNHLPDNLNPLSFQLQIQQLIPVFASPELHPFIQDHPGELYQQVKNGAFVQISAASILGKHGGKVKKFANQLIEANLVHFLASGVHDTKKESFYLAQAYKQIEKVHGSSTVEMFQQNIHSLIIQERIVGYEPHRIQQKKLLGFI